MITRFVPNRSCPAKLAVGAEMIVMLHEVAEAGAEEARRIAPVDTGEYQESIVAEAGVEGATARGRVNAHKFTAGWIEFGTSRMAAQAVLRRGAEAAGLKVRATGGRSG